MKKSTLIGIIAIAVSIVIGTFILTQGHNVAILNPQGVIAAKQRDLILFTVLLGMLVVVPVFIMLFVIAWKYRATNTSATYEPNWDHHRLLETIWWGIPCLIILVLSVITWRSTHALDPYKPLAGGTKPLTVQVVALQWRWLFIYPEQHVASINLLQIPEKTPIDFQLTSDAPMNSFWIPNLGGQVYAMSGMSTQLHLMADTTGTFPGSSANISGEGFAGMNFIAQSLHAADFDAWVARAQQSSRSLDATSYEEIARPNKDASITSYTLKQPDLYDTIVNKYMAPKDTENQHDMGNMEGMKM